MIVATVHRPSKSGPRPRDTSGPKDWVVTPEGAALTLYVPDEIAQVHRNDLVVVGSLKMAI
jgi:hypothetical protein